MSKRTAKSPEPSSKPASPKPVQKSLRTVFESFIRVSAGFAQEARKQLENLPDGWYHGDSENDLHIQDKHGLPRRYLVLKKTGAEFRLFDADDCHFIDFDHEDNEKEALAELAENLPEVSNGKVWADLFGSISSEEVIELAGFAGNAYFLKGE